MRKKRRTGVLLILLGIGIPAIFFFAFGDEVNVVFKEPEYSYSKIEVILDPKKPEDAERIKNWERMQYLDALHYANNPEYKRLEAETDERGFVHIWETDTFATIESEGFALKLTINFFLVVGIVFVLTGIGKVVFSFIPKEEKQKGASGPES